MNYIIDPMWFYWISVANKLVTAFAVLGGVFVAITVISGIVMFSTFDADDDDYKDYKTAKKILKMSIPFSIAFIMLAIFIPSKEVLMEMQIAKFATYENAEWTIDAIKSLVDYIVEAMKSV